MSLMLGEEMPADLLSGGMPRAGAAKGEVATFYMRTVPDKDRTAAEGRPIHKSAEYVEIRVPGDRTNVADKPATDELRRRFSAAYAAFKEGSKEQVVGTPLKVWPRISSPEIEDLKHLRIRTVEELAAVTDGNLQALGAGGRALRDEARLWLEAAKGTAPISRLQAEIISRDEKISALEARLNEMQKALERASKGK